MTVLACLKIIPHFNLIYGELGNVDSIDLRFIAETVAFFGTNDHFVTLTFLHGEEAFFETLDDLARAGKEFKRTSFGGLVQDLASLVAQGVIEADDLLCGHLHTQSPLLLLGKP